ncbi:hypothetical protein Hanom_Chr11g01050041 [Helianthus anomalus]
MENCIPLLAANKLYSSTSFTTLLSTSTSTSSFTQSAASASGLNPFETSTGPPK